MRFLILFCLIIIATLPAKGQDKLLSILETELKREMEGFAKVNQPPYFISYSVTDAHAGEIMASFGSLIRSDTTRSRMLSADVRVGDYGFDDSHPSEEAEDMRFMGMNRGANTQLPYDNHAEAIQLLTWRQTQESYTQALEAFKSKRSQRKPEPDSVGDFSREPVAVSVEPPLEVFSRWFDPNPWKARMQKLSAPFKASAYAVEGDVSLQVGIERRYFISSEGTQIVQNRTYAYLHIRGAMRAAGSDIVRLHRSYFAFHPSGLPNEEALLADVNEMIGKLDKLRSAPIAEPYTGPAILHARAAGVFFHEIFGHRVEGHRLKDRMDGQTFKDKVKQQVLPSTISVVFDPTLTKFKGQELNGHYTYDDEGVKGEKVRVVNRGVLETFLMSRTPIENFPRSNGHGRADQGASPVSRQSNLIVENEKVVSMPDLRKMLIAECKKQTKAYGYLFMDVVGGFTTTQRFMPNAFNIFPTEVYRIYVDGRPDELVRGVDLIGTPLAMFAEIEAADGASEVFTGFCGAESGNVPVTAISPSLFVKRIETQKKPATQVGEMLLSRPGN